MAQELTVRRGGDDPSEALKAHVEAQLRTTVDKAVALELGEAPFPYDWEVLAWGPYQAGLQPGRIIELGQPARIGVAVWMNALMYANMIGFGGKIELSYWTSNTQTMQPVPAMAHVCCIYPTDPCAFPAPAGGCIFVTVWEFVPTEAACVLETNICARICNCDNKAVPGYAAFVRHCWDFDPETVFPPYPAAHVHPAGWRFDRPIRYMVSDLRDCVCDPDNPCP